MQAVGFGTRIRWQLNSALAIAAKDARIYYLKPPVLIFGIVFPIFIFSAFIIGRNISADILLPGLIGMTLIFTASSSTPGIAPWETARMTLERLISTPASIAAIISGDILAGFLYGLFITLVALFIGVLILGASIISPLILAADIIISAFCFAALGSLLSTLPTDNPSNIMLVSNLVRLPLLFISGVFIPIERLPSWGKAISAFSPLTYSCDLARHALLGDGYFPVPFGLSVLLAFTVGFYFIGIQIHKKSMPLRLS
ncbi:MAG: ABC transporter permease [Deltaproteobacteria bacterium]|nr:ABC transporter permease [Deltaproteobacteria bacterium]MBW2086022.1 ABC transporter permease [Deltaproteobacteria bacterium]